LGIWGDAALLGKSTDSDLVSGKKTLPVVFALAKHGPFAQRWLAGPISVAEVDQLARQLRAEGAEEFTLDQVKQYSANALESLQEAVAVQEVGAALEELTMKLLQRSY
jgi:geranylgeranyl diphosphate synthase type I